MAQGHPIPPSASRRQHFFKGKKIHCAPPVLDDYLDRVSRPPGPVRWVLEPPALPTLFIPGKPLFFAAEVEGAGSEAANGVYRAKPATRTRRPDAQALVLRSRICL